MDRPPLDRATLARLLPSPWTRIDVVDELDSTNRALLDDPAPGKVLVAEHQLAGRGRLNRAWIAPARSALTFSVCLRPAVETSRWAWLPLLAGVALCDAVRSATGLAVGLKWPNDLLLQADGHKLAGILAQAGADGVVVGIGLNVSTSAVELPVATATSLRVAGAEQVDRTDLLLAIMGELGARYLSWQAADGDAEAGGLADDYRGRCATIGRPVTVTHLDGMTWAGVAQGVDSDGRLELLVDSHLELLAAGDVEHVRADVEAPRKAGSG